MLATFPVPCAYLPAKAPSHGGSLPPHPRFPLEHQAVQRTGRRAGGGGGTSAGSERRSFLLWAETSSKNRHMALSLASSTLSVENPFSLLTLIYFRRIAYLRVPCPNFSCLSSPTTLLNYCDINTFIHSVLEYKFAFMFPIV